MAISVPVLVGSVVDGNNLATITLPIPVAGQRAWAFLYNRDSTASFSTGPDWQIRDNFPHTSGGLRGRIQTFSRSIQPGDAEPIFTRAGGGSGNTTIGFMISFTGSASRISRVQYYSSAAQQNIGPYDEFSPNPPNNNGAVLIFGAKATTWTSISSITPGYVNWQRILEFTTTLGNDAGIVLDWGPWSGPPPGTITSKTYTVTGGAVNASLGFIFEALADEVEGAVDLAAQRGDVAATVKMATPFEVAIASRRGTMDAEGDRTIKSFSAPLWAQTPATISATVSTSTGISGTASLEAQQAAVIVQAGAGQFVYALGTPPDAIAPAASLSATVVVGTVDVIEDIGSPAELIARAATVSTAAGKLVASVSANLIAGRGTLDATTGVERIAAAITLTSGAATLVGGSFRNIFTTGADLEVQVAHLAGVGAKGQGIIASLAAGEADTNVSSTVRRIGSSVLVAGVAATAAVGGPSPVGGGAIGTGELFADPGVLTTTAQHSRVYILPIAAGSALVEMSQLSRTIQGSGQLRAAEGHLIFTTAFGDIATWESDNAIWGQPSLIHARNWPVFTKDAGFFQGDVTSRFDKSPVRVILERTGLTVLGRDRQGNWKNDPGIIKFISGLWPVITGVPGTVIHVYIGGQMNIEDPVDWEQGQDYILGVTKFLDFTVSGRYVALRFESEGQDPWELVSYDIEVVGVGER